MALTKQDRYWIDTTMENKTLALEIRLAKSLKRHTTRLIKRLDDRYVRKNNHKNNKNNKNPGNPGTPTNDVSLPKKIVTSKDFYYIIILVLLGLLVGMDKLAIVMGMVT